MWEVFFWEEINNFQKSLNRIFFLHFFIFCFFLCTLLGFNLNNFLNFTQIQDFINNYSLNYFFVEITENAIFKNYFFDINKICQFTNSFLFSTSKEQLISSWKINNFNFSFLITIEEFLISILMLISLAFFFILN